MFETILGLSILHLIAVLIISMPFEDDLIETTEFNFITVFFIFNIVINPIALTFGLVLAISGALKIEYTNTDQAIEDELEDRKNYIDNCRKLIK